jgi:hypothetical protein
MGLRPFLFVLPLLLPAAPLAAQGAGAWNSERALELIGRTQERRATTHADTTLRNYRADAHGFVYFYLDRKETEERTLVKVDQVALEVYWGAPDRTKQRIMGLRDESRLPNRMHYHLDHLTVVQDEFGDAIRLGDGDEVQDVTHPAAPGATAVYDYRLSDSLTLRLPGAPEPVRVYQLDVRPKRFSAPGFVGAVYVDRASAAIVRMTFTFTPASYVDKRLDYIHLALDNGLWDGRHWLPHEQRIEIRRQLPELDFPAGGVIRGVMRISGYDFNIALPDGFFAGHPVVAMPPSMRQAYPFPRELYDDLDAEGLLPPPELAELRQRAAELVEGRYLSGLPRLRLHLPDASGALRYNRTEGIFLGGGALYTVAPGTQFELRGGYGFGAARPQAEALLRRSAGPNTLRLRGFAGVPRDMGVRPGAAGALNTLAAAFTGSDYLDPYRATGAAAGWERRLTGAWRLQLDGHAERHRSAQLAEDGALFDRAATFRPVRPVAEGTLLGGSAALRRLAERGVDAGWSAGLRVEAGSFEGDGFALPTVEAGAHRRTADRATTLEVRAEAGTSLGTPPPQRLFLLGGPGTLPGYDYRSSGGNRYALADAVISREVLGPWVRVRALGALGWSGFTDGAAPPAAWDAPGLRIAPTDGVRASAGFGVGVVWDILRVDMVRGLNGGAWRGVVSVNPELWDIL